MSGVREWVEILQNERKAVINKDKWMIIGINLILYPVLILIISALLVGVEELGEYLPCSGLLVLFAILIALIGIIFLPSVIFINDIKRVQKIDDFIDKILKGFITIENFHPEYQKHFKEERKEQNQENIVEKNG